MGDCWLWLLNLFITPSNLFGQMASLPLYPFLHLLFKLSGSNCLLSYSLLSGNNGSPDTRFSRGDDTANVLARRETLLVPSTIPSSSFLNSRIYSFLFSDWRLSVSHRFRQCNGTVSTENLGSLVTLAVPSRHRCNGHSLLLSFYLSWQNGESFMQHL